MSTPSIVLYWMARPVFFFALCSIVDTFTSLPSCCIQYYTFILWLYVFLDVFKLVFGPTVLHTEDDSWIAIEVFVSQRLKISETKYSNTAFKPLSTTSSPSVTWCSCWLVCLSSCRKASICPWEDHKSLADGSLCSGPCVRWLGSGECIHSDCVAKPQLVTTDVGFRGILMGHQIVFWV